MATCIQAPALPVLVRTDAPGKPLMWLDPTPHAPDVQGHVWTVDPNEPCCRTYCLLCCEEHDDRTAANLCRAPELIVVINEHRGQWIAEHLVERGQ